jgi:hypothetical protein
MRIGLKTSHKPIRRILAWAENNNIIFKYFPSVEQRAFIGLRIGGEHTNFFSVHVKKWGSIRKM